MPHGSVRAMRVSVNSNSSPQIVLREAKRLHRVATSDSLADALPVLRRLMAAQAVPGDTLPRLFRSRAIIQRKHVLRTLAVEAGYKSWEDYSRALPSINPQTLAQSLLSVHSAANLKRWFTSEVEAVRFASVHGGLAARVGNQAVVLQTDEADQAGGVRLI